MKGKTLWVAVAVIAFFIGLGAGIMVQKKSAAMNANTGAVAGKGTAGVLTQDQKDTIVGQVALSIAANSEKIAKDLVSGLESSNVANDAMKVVLDKAKMQGPPKPPMPGAQQPEDANKVYDIDLGKSYAKGPKDAPVTIVDFADFQCPFCGRGNQTMKQVLDAYPGKIRFVFKAKILEFHQKARPAHRASLAAGEQGKFWEMYDLIFSNQQDMSEDTYVKYAEQLKLNVNKFKADMESAKYDQFLDDEGKQADALGVRGTPTFFINGRQIRGAQPFENFKTVIDDELAKKGAK